MEKLSYKKGFTLIELVIVLGLLVTVITFVFSPVIFSYQNFTQQNQHTQRINKARETMDFMSREIRKSDFVEVISNHKLHVDENIYEFNANALYKNNIKIIDQINDMTMSQENQKIQVQLTIKDAQGKEHTLSSVIILR